MLVPPFRSSHEPGQARTGRTGGPPTDRAWRPGSYQVTGGRPVACAFTPPCRARPTAPGMTPRSGRFRVRPVRRDQPHHHRPLPASLAVHRTSAKHGCGARSEASGADTWAWVGGPTTTGDAGCRRSRRGQLRPDPQADSADSVARWECPAPLFWRQRARNSAETALATDITTPLPSLRSEVGRGGSGLGRPAQPGPPAAARQAAHRSRSSGGRWPPGAR
jgi:hypothetical protein